MRISDWSSDVCSSDLHFEVKLALRFERFITIHRLDFLLERRCVEVPCEFCCSFHFQDLLGELTCPRHAALIDRKSVVWGKSVSVRVDLGGTRIIKKKQKNKKTT